MASVNVRLLSAIKEDDELLLLSCTEKEIFQRNFNLESFSDEECKSMFRLYKEDIIKLVDALQIPPRYICDKTTVVGGTEGLCVLLRRLAYPNRYSDLRPIFGKSTFELSHVFTTVLDDVHERYGYLLTDLNRRWLSHNDLNEMAAAVRHRESPLANCWGFIDGTVRPICRPIYDQRIVFNGHKRTHAIQLQCISTPNGIIANMSGPIEGRRHDAAMLRESGILRQLEDHMTLPNGDVYSIYGDPAYPNSAYIITPFRNAILSLEEREFNKKMSAVRTSVEWTFGKILGLFHFLDFKINQKLYLQPVGKYYHMASLLTNCHTCLYGSETGSYFGMDPPTFILGHFRK